MTSNRRPIKNGSKRRRDCFVSSSDPTYPTVNTSFLAVQIPTFFTIFQSSHGADRYPLRDALLRHSVIFLQPEPSVSKLGQQNRVSNLDPTYKFCNCQSDRQALSLLAGKCGFSATQNAEDSAVEKRRSRGMVAFADAIRRAACDKLREQLQLYAGCHQLTIAL